MLEPDEIEDLVVAELGLSAVRRPLSREHRPFAADPGARTRTAHAALAAATQSPMATRGRHGEFPVVFETYRECLRDVLDVPGLVELLTGYTAAN